MSNKQLRNIIRIVHLIAGVCIFALVYPDAPRTSPAFITLMQVVIVPAVVLSGIAMWQQAAISRFRRRMSGNKQNALSSS